MKKIVVALVACSQLSVAQAAQSFSGTYLCQDDLKSLGIYLGAWNIDPPQSSDERWLFKFGIDDDGYHYRVTAKYSSWERFESCLMVADHDELNYLSAAQDRFVCMFTGDLLSVDLDKLNFSVSTSSWTGVLVEQHVGRCSKIE